MKPVDPLILPLDGVSLIEASAGTGKTTALVRLYLRALLTTQLTIDQLLVVTFTHAATGELKTRIRAALAGVLEVLEERATPDAFQARLFAAEPDSDLLLRRVRAAFSAFDDCAVFTIHGFCQRMLSDMAFETGSAFETESCQEEQSLRHEVLADFWRRRQATANRVYAQWMLTTFGAPDALWELLRSPFTHGDGLHLEPRVEADAVAKVEGRFDTAAKVAAQTWQEQREALREWLLNSDALNRKSYNPKTLATLLEQWAAWLEAPTVILPDKFGLLTHAMMSSKLNKSKSLPDLKFIQQKCGDLLSNAADALHRVWWQDSYAAALDYLRDETRRRKQRARQIGFDDMLGNLHRALQGRGGAALAQRIVSRYPLTMIDEFQDTDQRQYEIFTALQGAGRAQAAGLILIGDPKQAIYRFRGGDVFTYMRARRACGNDGRIFSLDHNYRTAGPLIDAVNALFGNSSNPFLYKEIPFVEVKPGHEIAPLTTTAGDAPLTVVWQSPPGDADKGRVTKAQALPMMAELCAREIERLLELGERDQASYVDEKTGRTPVRGRDIAVLVATHKQGGAVQQALRARGIASVILSTDSVLETAEADELSILLEAVVDPANAPLLRRALVTGLLGLTSDDLLALEQDEARWSVIVTAFRDYRQRWETQGFSAMFAQLLRERGVIVRTLSRPDGERAMTNLRHLSELIEAQAAQHPGIEALLGWYVSEREHASAGIEERELRLESDAELVRIVTVHKAKGLEYPVVFLPFLWDAKKPSNQKLPAVMAHETAGRGQDYEAILDLGTVRFSDRRQAAETEAFAEQLRLTYVALTRASRACYVLATAVNQCQDSALAKLLGCTSEPAELEAGLAQWCGDTNARSAPVSAPGAACFRAPENASRPLSQVQQTARHGQARKFSHGDRLQQRFHIASYSRLAAGASGASAEAPDQDEHVAVVTAGKTATGIHAFPAGAASGTFLHAVLEAVDFDAGSEALRHTVESLCASYGFELRWVAILCTWLTEMLATPLVPAGCRLADVSRDRRVDEMEFHFPIETLEARRLHKATLDFAPDGRRPALAFAPVSGQMKGYLDLVFEHEGRYWVVDYKSNRLGDDLAAYTPSALDQAMVEHRYDLQYLLYTVALHRYLATRIPDYDYERHFGGVMYLFLRGMAPDAPAPRGVWHTRPDYARLQRFEALLDANRAGTAPA